MGRIFRAFVWMRWRVLVNSLERTGSRDRLERFSIAIERLGPIMAMLLLIPSSVGVFVLGMGGGFGLATAAWTLPMQIIRIFLFIGLLFTIIGPMVLPTRDGDNAVRLLLLPIPRWLLYAAQVAGAMADPWIILMIPLIVGVPIGLAVGLAFTGALVALLAGVAFVVILASLTALASSVIHLLLRDRRRGEIVMLLVIIVLPLIGFLPRFIVPPSYDQGRRLTREERRAQFPTWPARVAARVEPLVPSELYHRAAIAGRTNPASAAKPLAALAALAVGIVAVGFAAFRRVLDMPMTMGVRRAGSFGGLWDRVIPGLSPGASAVAFAQFRLALRSPRGRATMFTPVLMPLVMGGVLFRHGGELASNLGGDRGVALAAFGCFASMLALLPLAMNQFAIEKAGFTRQMLLPLSIRELLTGKAVGNALIAGAPALFCFVVGALVFPGTSLSLWLSLPFALIATYVLFAPAAAAFSAIFPKVADLNSIGNSGNAHQAAGILGLLWLASSAAPSAVLLLLATGYLHRVDLLPLMTLAWCAIAFGLSQALFIPVRRLVASRCETLAHYY